MEKVEIGAPSEKYLERQKMEEELEKNAAMLIQHMKLQRIDSFTGYFEFLHNNFLTPVYFEGSLYPSVTHSYHAARSQDETTRKAILNADSFHTVAKIATRIEDPENWSKIRIKVMERLVRDKFRRSRELQEKLKATDKRELIMSYEDETQGNLFWGMIKSKGQNQLGRILMKIREDIINGREVINWITTNFELVTDINFLPEIVLNVNKNNVQIDHLVLKNKPFYKFGQLEDSDVILAHPSISRFHAVIICDGNLGVILIDLKSKAGTKLDNDIIKDHIPYRLKDGKKITFGMSTRDYIVSIDLSKVKKVYEREKLKLEDEKKLIERIKDNKEEIMKKSFKLDDEQSLTVFVNHVPNCATEENIKKLFEEQFGEVSNIQWPNDRVTGLKKNYLFVQFKDLESAKEAAEYGIIGYEDENENEFEEFDEKKNSFMMKIKFADNDKYKPDFSRDRRGISQRENKRDHKSDHHKSDYHKSDHHKSDYNKSDYHKSDHHKSDYNKSESKSNLKKEYDKYNKNRNKRKDESSSSSESKSDSSSDYYSSDDSKSNSSSSSYSSSETEKITPKKDLTKKKRNRSKSSRSNHKRR